VWIDVSHLGAAVVERNFRGMVRRCRDFGYDLARGPVEVGPTTHFMMGGVVIDTACRTGVEGLFAAGEDTGGVHGANRLGGNGVAESTVFGGLAGDAMADAVAGSPRRPIDGAAAQAAAARVLAPLGRAAGAESVYELQSRLRDVMWDRVGLIRSGPGLRAALVAIEDIGRRLEVAGAAGDAAYNILWQDWLNLRNQVDVAWLIARSALARRESRGSHHRSDFPQPGADLYTVRVAAAAGGDARVWTEPVRLTRKTPGGALAPAAVEAGD
jgi:fumarate reductase flavoprotein subunit